MGNKNNTFSKAANSSLDECRYSERSMYSEGNVIFEKSLIFNIITGYPATILMSIVFANQGDQTEKNLIDLPEEIIEKILMDPALSYKDVKRIGSTIHSLGEIADKAIKKSKFTFL